MQSTTETMNLLNADYEGNFRKLPQDKKKLQLEFLLKRYHYRATCIGEFFNISQNTVWRILDSHDLMKKVKANTVSMSRKELKDIIDKARADRAAYFSATKENAPEPSQNSPEKTPTENISDIPRETSPATTDSNDAENDVKFFFKTNTELTGGALKDRLYGLAYLLGASDRENKYRVKIIIEEV